MKTFCSVVPEKSVTEIFDVPRDERMNRLTRCMNEFKEFHIHEKNN